MSKYTNGALQVLEAADTDINQTFTYTEETSECVICSTRRESGWVTVEKSGIISKIGEGIAATLGIAAGYLLRDLIVDKAVFQVKEAQLNRIGKTEVRMKDAAGSIFWARLTSKGENRLLIEDIDIEKNFELDGEDLIEEQEREFNRFCYTGNKGCKCSRDQDCFDLLTVFGSCCVIHCKACANQTKHF